MKTKTLFIHAAQATLIWLATNAIATTLYALATIVGIEFDPFICLKCSTTLMYVLVFGLIFSSPVIVLLIANLYLLVQIPTHRRVCYSFLSVGFICVIVITTFINLFKTNEFTPFTIVLFLLPYVFAALTSFMLIVKNLIWTESESLKQLVNRNTHER